MKVTHDYRVTQSHTPPAENAARASQNCAYHVAGRGDEFSTVCATLSRIIAKRVIQCALNHVSDARTRLDEST